MFRYIKNRIKSECLEIIPKSLSKKILIFILFGNDWMYYERVALD